MDQLKILKGLSEDKTLTQRAMSRKYGLSLGKVNYIVNALINAGLIKVERFKNSKNKAAYMYLLTPNGMAKKMELAYSFLKKMKKEYEVLEAEIEVLKNDLEEELNNRPDFESTLNQIDNQKISIKSKEWKANDDLPKLR